MKLNRYIDSKWHKRQIESFKNSKNKPYKELYFNDILPCIIYIMENTNFEVWFKHCSASDHVLMLDYAIYKLDTVKLSNIQKINEYQTGRQTLKNTIKTHIEGYLNSEASDFLKNKNSENELDSILTTNLKEMLVEALNTKQDHVEKTASDEELKLITEDGKATYKLEFKVKNKEKIK